jgi:ATP-dependent protease ClpP protease subunit
MNKRRREILAALAPVTEFAMERAGKMPKPASAPKLNVHNISSDTTEIMIYGVIGGGSWFDEGGVTSVQMSDALKEITSSNIHVRINSGGGDVFEGVAIHTLLSRHPATVTAYIDGHAASAASFIAMAGDRIVSARNAMMMIHDGMTFTYGGPKTHQRATDLLHKVSDNIADMYAMRTGGTAEEWRAKMSENDEDGTWYTGTEALEAGLVDELVESALPKVEDDVIEQKYADRFYSFEERQASNEYIPPNPPNTDEDNIRAQDQAFALLAAFKFAA